MPASQRCRPASDAKHQQQQCPHGAGARAQAGGRAARSCAISVPGYNFGREVPVDQALPGDVLSIDANGHHHVMLLMKPAPNLSGALIYHQNVNNQRFVVCDTFPMKMRDGVIVWRPGKK